MNLERLLIPISHINRKYEEIDKLTGRGFNIFNLLNIDEISHSKIIAMLLNPKGMHGKGDTFIHIFLAYIGIRDFIVDNITTEPEKFIGHISDNYDSGGRIDIVLTNSWQQRIFIENKIYATDQKNQLLRYHKYDPKACLLYLTLYGDEPSKNTLGGGNFKYETISYKEHILGWLKLCKKESIDSPLLRETLTQYIVQIKQLTGQTRSTEMQKEYIDTILNDESNVLAALTISRNIDEVKLAILKRKFKPLVSNLADELGFEVVVSDMSLSICFGKTRRKWWGFYFKKPEWKTFQINFEFQMCNLHDLVYGFNAGTPPVNKNLDTYLRSVEKYTKSKGWPLYRRMDDYRDWEDDFFLDLFSNPDKISAAFKNKIEEMLSIVENKGFDL